MKVSQAAMACALLIGVPMGLAAQDLPTRDATDDVPTGYRRTPRTRIDPFTHILIPHWGLVVSGGAVAENNSVNLNDLGALLYLNKQDSLRAADALDALGLIPQGSGLGGSAQGEAGVYVGGPLMDRFAVGFSVYGRGYGGFAFDDQAVALLRDGTAGGSEFSLGDSRGSVLSTVEGGVHGLARLDGPGGSTVTLGAGARYIRPLYYAQGKSLLDNGGVVVLTGDTIQANIAIEAYQTPQFEFNQATGIAGDLLVRVEWPAQGLALEGVIANLGSVSVSGVERRTLTLDIETTKLDELSGVLDTLELAVQDTMEVALTLPRLVRFTGSAWTGGLLQLDVSTTLRTGGEFAIPVAVDLGSTWRFVQTMPLRLGLVFGGHQGLGYTAGFGIEARNLFFNVSGGTLGGFVRNAKGMLARVDMGFFF